LVGGECPYYACVPTKMMIRGSDLLAEGRRISGMSGESSVRPDWTPVARRLREEATDNWNDKVAVERFEQKGGRFVRGSGRFEAPDRVSAGNGAVFHARRAVVVATGTAPAVPPIEGLHDARYWTNREAVKTERVPETLAVLGGGPVGLEMAQAFSRFGSRVTVIEAGDRLLALDEPESSQLIADVFKREGIEVRTGASAQGVSSNGGITVSLSDGSSVTAETLLVATGRRNNLAALQLGKAALDENARSLQVDEHLRVAPGIWAVGDVTGKGAFTHVSMYQAEIATADILGRNHAPADYRALPRVTFTDPEIGSTGMSEKAARESGINVRTGHANIATTTRGWIHKVGNDGFIKLVEDADRGVLIGATSAGPVGGEVLSMLTVAVHAEVPVSTLRTMITAYPTFHRGLDDALRDLER
ncbi:MAG: NAD(P)/FAD-dependent oxidoreductase, partial [Candidatus Dormibacteria bacterium]